MRLPTKTRTASLVTFLLACTATGAVVAAPADGPKISTLAGTGERGFGGDGGPHSSGVFNGPRRVAFARDGVLVADVNNHRVRKLGYDGTV